MKMYDDYLRWLYRGGHPRWLARVQNHASAIAFAAGIARGRAAEMQVRGRSSGRLISFPVVIVDYEGERYLVSMLGDDVNWVRNLRAAGGRTVLRHGRREVVRLQEVDPRDRAPILRRYLQVAPGARPHIPVSRKARRPTLSESARTSRCSASSPMHPETPAAADAADAAALARSRCLQFGCRHGFMCRCGCPSSHNDT